MQPNYHRQPQWQLKDIQDARETLLALLQTPLNKKITQEEKLMLIGFVCDKFDVRPRDLKTNNTYN